MPATARSAATTASASFSVSTRILLAATCLFGAQGCGHDEPLRPPGGPPTTTGTPGESVAVAAQGVQSGFALGHMRKSVDLDAFRISRVPITIGEYRACVDARGCEVPPETACANSTLGNFKREGTPGDVPLTCAGLTGARQYCTWVGGSLPTLEQWLLAARGPSPQRYPWGATAPTCAQHAYGVPNDRKMASSCAQSGMDVVRVGQHAAGASVFGVQDVLLTPGELLDASPEALFPACEKREQASPQHVRSCVVNGLEPGSIDSVYELESTPEQKDSSINPYGFRCVWGGAS